MDIFLFSSHKKYFFIVSFFICLSLSALWKSEMANEAKQLLEEFETLLTNKEQKKFFETISQKYFNIPHKVFDQFGKKIAKILNIIAKEKKFDLKPIDSFTVTAVPEVIEFLNTAPSTRKWVPESIFVWGENFPEGHPKYHKMRYNPFAKLLSSGLKSGLEQLFFNDPDMINLIKTMPTEINRVSMAEWLGKLDTQELRKAEELFDPKALEAEDKTFKLNNINNFQVAGLNTQLMSLKTLGELAKNIPLLQKFKLTEINTPITFWLPYEKKSSSDYLLNESTIEHITRRSLLLLEMPQIFSTDDIKDVSIIFAPTLEHKLFPEEGIFNSESINSAYYDPILKILVIFRKEELLKTLVHELYHLINIDKKLDSKETKNWAKDHFAIEYTGGHTFLLSESIVETLACLTNIAICAYYASFKEKKKTLLNNIMHDMLSTEQLFSAYQSAKILVSSGFENLETFLKPTETELRVKESTAAVEYHLLKSALLFRPDEFLKILMDKNNIEKRAELFENLILDGLDNSVLKDVINTFITMIRNGDDKNSETLHRTGRMTIVDIKN